ncbi:MAG: cation:proton antiporter [Rhodospirillales bacterium]|nr:cation:proton antiporter [Rhodospirillales bacterium]
MDAFGQTFLEFATTVAFASLLVAFAFTVYRLLRGPSFADRVLSLDFLMLIGIGFIAVKALASSEFSYIDVAIAMALVGFLATVAFARYIHRRARATDAEPNEDLEEVPLHSSGGIRTASRSGQGGEP